MASLTYCHEVTDNSLICDGDRATGCNLLLKERNDTTSGAQDIAKSCGGTFDLSSGAISLHDHLTHSFGGTHYIGRVNCFVCRDHHESGYSILFTEFDDIEASIYIVLYSLNAVMFHQWNMLMSGSIDYNIRLISFEDTRESFLVCY